MGAFFVGKVDLRHQFGAVGGIGNTKFHQPVPASVEVKDVQCVFKAQHGGHDREDDLVKSVPILGGGIAKGGVQKQIKDKVIFTAEFLDIERVCFGTVILMNVP